MTLPNAAESEDGLRASQRPRVRTWTGRWSERAHVQVINYVNRALRGNAKPALLSACSWQIELFGLLNDNETDKFGLRLFGAIDKLIDDMPGITKNQ